MKKKLMIALSSFLLILSIIPLSASFEAFNLESHAHMTYDSFNSGQKNSIEFKLKATGAHTTFTNLKVDVLMPDFVQMDITSIKNALGADYNVTRTDQGMSITKEIFESGTYLELPFIFSVPNGVTPTSTPLTFNVKVATDQVEKTDQVLTTTVEASSPLKLTKAYEGLKDSRYSGSLGLSPGMESVWVTKAQIDRQDQGQLYIKEGSRIRIQETYHESLEYQGMIEGPNPDEVDRDTRTLIWYFDAPTYLEQDQLDALLFQKNLKVNYRANPRPLDVPIPEVRVTSRLEFTNVDDVVLEDTSYAETTLYPSESETPEVDGNWYVPGHFSPIDPFGKHSTDFEALNKRPTVYPWATLTYAHQMTALEHGADGRYVEYKWNYYINKHLRLESFKAPGRFDYRPTTDYGDATPLHEQPILHAHVYDDQKQIIATFKDLSHDQIITREEILKQKNLPETTQIAQIQYDFESTVPGMMIDEPLPQEHNGLSRMPTYTFSIKDTWREDAKENITELKNEMDIETAFNYGSSFELVRELYDFKDNAKNDYTITFPDGRVKAWFEGFHFLAAPRWANVTENPEAYHPTVTNSIELLDQYKGQIYKGTNKLKVQIVNEPSSVGAVRDNVHSIIYVPKSLQFKDLTPQGNIKSIKRLGESRGNHDVYHIEWNISQLAPYELASHSFDVEISGVLQDISLKIFTILEANDTFETLAVSNPTIQDTLVIDYDYYTTQATFESKKMLQSQNHYQMISDYQLKIKKWVKNENDTLYDTQAYIELNDKIDYKLQLTNHTGKVINEFVLMDILPNIGDRGITDFTQRNSEFDVSLNGPVGVDETLFNVFYSTSSNPSREDLNRVLTTEGFDAIVDKDTSEPNWITAEDVTDWKTIKSFKIELKDQKELSELQNFEFTFQSKITNPDVVTHKLESTPNLTAWNSFAVAINGHPTIEPLKVAVRTGTTIPEDKPNEPYEEDPKETPKETPKESENPTPALPNTGIASSKMPYLAIGLGSFFVFNGYKKRRK
ncbi:peptidase [Erysipelothrix rhusiopathiae]|uniref:peptidase n=1 Tax=Erysipelothrix rhusiopathiae TaxID=1648 RepID=UPI001EE07EB3|nr:peptidase [Erysipelothrix rhusiopathiae]MCG4437239.1 peptidase [Erysipelothrix rhusiopathiae]MCG4457483.1 peptidase [Erysipelothrix rhusiopathiae]MDE8033244.1 peptidase [Erysipelothrix rhusiopathiae]MDE8143215.1 peptidase [Erysipelothrix rhusiopathiae]MDE8163255.1 peptidase [Erysipelothrix rhusiopathiae]